MCAGVRAGRKGEEALAQGDRARRPVEGVLGGRADRCRGGLCRRGRRRPAVREGCGAVRSGTRRLFGVGPFRGDVAHDAGDPRVPEQLSAGRGRRGPGGARQHAVRLQRRDSRSGRLPAGLSHGGGHGGDGTAGPLGVRRLGGPAPGDCCRADGAASAGRHERGAAHRAGAGARRRRFREHGLAALRGRHAGRVGDGGSLAEGRSVAFRDRAGAGGGDMPGRGECGGGSTTGGTAGQEGIRGLYLEGTGVGGRFGRLWLSRQAGAEHVRIDPVRRRG